MKTLLRRRILLSASTAAALLVGLVAWAASTTSAANKPLGDDGWIPLFNGKDLTGWTPKITGYEAGDNHNDTFRVEDGVLKVSYDKYKNFDGHFGHLFSKSPYSHYRLRIEYRFVGDQCPGGPSWATRNSGVMIHSQPIETMKLAQEFPASIEVQFLGGLGKGQRPTANLCTPGTNVEYEGKLWTQHCTNSKSKTYDGDQWVTVEIEVHGNSTIKHVVDGKTVIEYSKPQLDPEDADGKRLIKNGEKMLSEGYLALQAESHPIEFRRVEILPMREAK